MPLFLMPNFINDLQTHADANFARRVLKKTIRTNGEFRSDPDDHRYGGIDDAWIRYVSRGHTAYRVIYLRYDEDIYLFRAGEHSIEERLVAPETGSITTAIPVAEGGEEIVETIATMPAQYGRREAHPPANRFRRNAPHPQINREIFSRRNLPHSDIWFIAPFIDGNLFLPTAVFGKLLLEQVEDGASVAIITAPPKDNNIEWMEKLNEQGVGIFVYPRLHTKLYCFIFDEKRRYEPGLQHGDHYSSLILLGSANLTIPGLAVDTERYNEELCYAVPDDGIGYVESYVAELMMHGYELTEVRRFLARGQLHKLENKKW